METHSSILTWKIPWIEESDGLQPMGSQRLSAMTEQLVHVSLLNFYFEINVDIQKNCNISIEHS